jgi:hypothetical protein
MAKRFPIPEFEYEELRGRAWTPPSCIDAGEAARLRAAAKSGDTGAFGAYPVQAPDAFFDALNVRGEHRTAVLCLLPAAGVTMLGRSHAWKRQRVAVVDGVPDAAPRLLAQWKTPRPMNTRLGPEDGAPAPGAALTLVFGHLFADHWVGNRVAVDAGWAPESGEGLRVLSSDDASQDDFHCAVMTFRWGG